MESPDDLFRNLREFGWQVERQENLFQLISVYRRAGEPFGPHLKAFHLWTAFETHVTAN